MYALYSLKLECDDFTLEDLNGHGTDDNQITFEKLEEVINSIMKDIKNGKIDLLD